MELDQAFSQMDGHDGDVYQETIKRLQAEFTKEMEAGGKAWEGLMEIGELQAKV